MKKFRHTNAELEKAKQETRRGKVNGSR